MPVKKSWRNLYERVVPKEEWYKALHDASKGKMKHPDIKRFYRSADGNLMAVRDAVLSGEWRGAPGEFRTITDPKPRHILLMPFADRVTHHVLADAMTPHLDKYLIPNTFGGIAGRGQHKASAVCQTAVRRFKWCLKCDIRHFYPSIDRDLLFHALSCKIRDPKYLALLHEDIYCRAGTGVPIGSLMSVLYGNFFLTPVDRMCIEMFRVGCYCRYCDDFLLFDDDKPKLLAARDALSRALADRHLEFSKCVLNRSDGIAFVGYRHFKGFRLVTKREVKRALARANDARRLLGLGRMTFSKVEGVVDSIWGWFKWADWRGLADKFDLGVVTMHHGRCYMRGFPKRVATWDDVVHCAEMYPRQTRRLLDDLVDGMYGWRPVAWVPAGQEGVTDESHKVQVCTDPTAFKDLGPAPGVGSAADASGAADSDDSSDSSSAGGARPLVQYERFENTGCDLRRMGKTADDVRVLMERLDKVIAKLPVDGGSAPSPSEVMPVSVSA